MRSMTSYGYAEFSNENYLLTMELKSYNNRYLEVNYSGPSCISAFEKEMTDAIKDHAARGHIDISVKIRNLKGSDSIQVDENALKAYVQAFEKIERLSFRSGVRVRTSMSDIISQDGVLVSAETRGMDKYREGLDACKAKVLAQFDESKDREGEVTRKDLSSKIDGIEASLEVVKANADRLESMIKDNLKSRIAEMLGDKEYDEGRVLTEVAVMLMRYTINEEVVRLGAHIAEFRKLLSQAEPVGKKMDFLCQEMNREINTIGSKSQIVEINFEVVNMKDCLENIREQVRNIE